MDVLPSNIALAGAEIEIVEMDDRAVRLKKALVPVKNRYDFIFIDCPPSLGLITLNALAASDTLMVPIQCEYYALEGLSQLVFHDSTSKKALQPYSGFGGRIIDHVRWAAEFDHASSGRSEKILSAKGI